MDTPSRIIRIGTRESELAMWQAKKVQYYIETLGYQTEIIPITSQGDLDLVQPLYEMGTTGIFTKYLDVALLNKNIDVAVHSLKDVPTNLPLGIMQGAVLKRANPSDILVIKNNEEFLASPNATIATGSLRRKAMWLDRYPTHTVVNLRGNVNTRLEKVDANDWDGAIFAAAGLERLGKRPKGAIHLPWMIPAPGQGAIMVACLDDDYEVVDLCKQFNDEDTALCVGIEREFLNILEGGCTAPIGAYARINEVTKDINFEAVLLKKDGSKKIAIQKTALIGRHRFLAKDAAQYMIEKGAKQILAEDNLRKNTVKIYSTKQLSNAQKSLFNENLLVEESDLIKIRFNRISKKNLPETIDDVVITSQNAVEALLFNFSKKELALKNIYCVGRRTKKLIESKLGKVTHVAANAEALVGYFKETNFKKPLTYFCSNLRLDEFVNALKDLNIQLSEFEVYNTYLSPVKIDADLRAVMFYSPSGVESFIQSNQANTIAFCIGDTTAKEAKKYFKEVVIANFPSAESLIEAVNMHFTNE